MNQKQNNIVSILNSSDQLDVIKQRLMALDITPSDAKEAKTAINDTITEINTAISLLLDKKTELLSKKESAHLIDDVVEAGSIMSSVDASIGILENRITEKSKELNQLKTADNMFRVVFTIATQQQANKFVDDERKNYQKALSEFNKTRLRYASMLSLSTGSINTGIAGVDIPEITEKELYLNNLEVSQELLG
jgi:predicted  nucleic acid-binding Zn-ribbon protein